MVVPEDCDRSRSPRASCAPRTPSALETRVQILESRCGRLQNQLTNAEHMWRNKFQILWARHECNRAHISVLKTRLDQKVLFVMFSTASLAFWSSSIKSLEAGLRASGFEGSGCGAEDIKIRGLEYNL